MLGAVGGRISIGVPAGVLRRKVKVKSLRGGEIKLGTECTKAIIAAFTTKEAKKKDNQASVREDREAERSGERDVKGDPCMVRWVKKGK